MNFPCPVCNAATSVIDSRPKPGMFRRRRRCENGHRFSTNEVAVTPEPQVDHRIQDDYDASAMELSLREERGW